MKYWLCEIIGLISKSPCQVKETTQKNAPDSDSITRPRKGKTLGTDIKAVVAGGWAGREMTEQRGGPGNFGVGKGNGARVDCGHRYATLRETHIKRFNFIGNIACSLWWRSCGRSKFVAVGPVVKVSVVPALSQDFAWGLLEGQWSWPGTPIGCALPWKHQPPDETLGASSGRYTNN